MSDNEPLCPDCPLPSHHGPGVTRCENCPYRIPRALDAIGATVLAYHPKPKSAAAKKRKRRATKIAKANG